MELNELLSECSSDGGKLVLMYLHRVGTATIDQLASVLDFQISKTYSVVSALEEKGLICKLEHTAQERYTLKQVSL
ncbi:hypothetical protein SAMN06264855_11022 [Halorubrum vacuolatum]|uniref:Sugar-specific transcriptional regulator TrmB n=1 Tax=Halorubrum vacuolatum TaxID=63740 RepID=A0A238WW24_HALVU|nr:hypothetical protein SAMN06264855_11022 [Halorubrum vacuolatum]